METDKDQRQKRESAELRSRAEERLKTQRDESNPPGAEEDTQRLVHELQVHQLELEMQNEELRQAREELETALEKYTDLYDFAPVGYFTLARDTGIRAANLAGADLLGLERSCLIGRRFELLVADDFRATFTVFLDRVFSRETKETCEVTLVKEGNQGLFVQIEALARKPGDACMVAVIDMTKRKLAEDVLAENRRELEELNSSLEKRIIQAVEDLRRKDQMLILQDRRAVMGEMLNNIAHQWRQPLNSLGLYIQELPLVYDSGGFSEEYLKNNTDEAMMLILHMSQTIDAFRDFFRSDKEIVAFDVNRVIGHTVSLIEKSFLDQQISIAFTSEGNPMVTGYPNEYAQVLLNILMNARDELVGRRVDVARISIQSFADCGKTVVIITDNAGGITEEIMDRLFDPYFTTKGPDKGTGVGLFMSKTIIETNMGGRLTVHNTENGAEFRIEV